MAREVSLESEWAISELDAEDKANDMHEAAVAEICQRLECGERMEEAQ